MSVLEVCFVRHAQSVSNAAGIWQGQGDSPLSEMGRTQVDALQKAIAGDGYDLVLSSDLSRAADTAEALGAPVEHDSRWREIDVGDWEGLTMDQVVERFPEQIAALRARRTFEIGGGESWPEVFARADGALHRIRERLPEGGRAIVFTHGGIIAAILAGLLRVRQRFPWPLGRMRNTARTTIRFKGGAVELVGHNDDSHLSAELRQAYQPRPEQVLLRLTTVETQDEALRTAAADFNSAIKSARNTGAGGVVSVSGTAHEIAELAQLTSGASAREFRLLPPLPGHSTELLISNDHQMLLDYSRPSFQI
jgi:broad specificity phosphatase PhoE